MVQILRAAGADKPLRPYFPMVKAPRTQDVMFSHSLLGLIILPCMKGFHSALWSVGLAASFYADPQMKLALFYMDRIEKGDTAKQGSLSVPVLEEVV